VTSILKAHPVAQRFRTFFTSKTSPNERGLRSKKGTHPIKPDVAELHINLERNFRTLSGNLNEIREWCEFLRQSLENKKLNRSQLCDYLFEFLEMADFGQNQLQERLLLEQQLTARWVSYSGTMEKLKVSWGSPWVGSNG
jgi:hypothetical protein